MKQVMQPISIVVPTLNEEGNIALLFKRIHVSLAHAGIPYEIIVVDDNSTDRTAASVEQAHPKYNARLLRKQGQTGKAFSLLEGFSAAQYELICMIDGDLQYPPEAIKLMYHKLQYCEADIVLTERTENKTSALRRLSSWTFNLVFTRALFGINYDTQSGLKLFRKSILKTLSIEPSPWTFDLEFIVKALEQNYVIVSQQIPFSKRNAGIAKVHIVSATAEIASGSLKLWRKTSIKHVRAAYKHSEILQRSTYGVLAIFTLLTLLVAAPAIHTNALGASLPPTKSTPDVSPIPSADPVFAPNSDLNPTPAPSTTPAPSPAPTAVPGAAQSDQPTPNATQPAPSGSSARSTVKSTAQPVRSGLSVSKTNQISTAQRALPIESSPSSDPFTLKTATGKNAAYYPSSALSRARTQNLHNLARNIVTIGGIFIAIGLSVLACKSLTARIRHQPLRI